MKKEKNAIFLADTRAFLIAHVLLQIKDTNPNLFDEAIIYHQNMSKKDMEIMKNIFHCRFINYDTDKLPDELFETNENFKRFTKFMFARYEMFNYLDEFDNILWIDTDVLIQGSLSDLIEKAKITGIAMLCEDQYNKSSKNTDINRTNFTKAIPGYEMNCPLYCSGTIVINKKLSNYKKVTEYLYDKTIEYADYLSLPDQGILNLMIQDFKFSVTPIGDNGVYGIYPYIGRDCSKAIFIHSWGKNKFWNSWYLFKMFPKWKYYYDEWVSLGGENIIKKFRPDISVLIPVYKSKIELFKIQLDSLVNQMQNSYENYTNFEIIIVAEPFELDKLDELINSYNDYRIVLIKNKERKGIAGSLNIGMKLAKGKYITRADDDDICTTDRLYKQYLYLENNPDVNLCTSNYEYFGDMNEGRITLEREMSHAWSIFTCPFDHPTIMFRKDFFIKNNLYYDESRSHVEDWELWLRAYDKGLVVGNIDEVLYYHRWYNGQAGQNEKTITMMRDLVKLNFAKLNINLTADDLLIVAPWQGKIDERKVPRLLEIFEMALKNNEQLKIYNNECLKKVFSYRVEEAKTGKLNGLTFEHIENKNNNASKTLKQKILGPVYRPFKRVFYNIMAEAVNDNLVNQKLFNEKKNENQKILNEVNINFNKAHEKFDDLNNQIRLLHDQLYDLEKKYDFIRDEKLSNLYFAKKIILIGTSEHSNIGDAAITFGEYEFIRKYFSDYKLIEVSTYEFNDILPYLENIINSDDLIFLQGGGNLGNKFKTEENVRRTIIENFPNNKIVILPQTIYFTDDAELEISKRIYNNHSNLTIFTRGHISLEFAKKNFPNAKCYESLDSALNLNFNFGYSRDGILCCLRDLNDESGLDKKTYEEIFKIIKSFDKDYSFTNNLWAADIKKDQRNYVVYEQLKSFAKHKLVVTDRLHGLIFSLITNTPCIVISAYNYKLKEFTDMLKNNNSIIFIDKDIDKLSENINKFLSKETKIQNNFTKNFINNAKIIIADSK